MWPGDLAPDHADLGTADLLLAPVDVSDLLSEVEATDKSQLKALAKEYIGVSYLAALVSSTPSILIRLVPGLVVWRER